MNTVIRAMQMADVDGVVAIEIAAYEFPWSRSLIEQAIISTKHKVVLEVNGTLAGYAILSFVVGEAELLNLCIAPDFQGKKLSHILLAQIIEDAKQHGNADMYLEVRESNVSARALYEAHDFNEIGRRKNYYPTKSGKEDAILMARSLAF